MQKLDSKRVKKFFKHSMMLHQRINEIRVEGNAGSEDLQVTVLINGSREVLALEISPDLMNQPLEQLQDLVAAAFNDAVHKLEGYLRVEFLTALS